MCNTNVYLSENSLISVIDSLYMCKLGVIVSISNTASIITLASPKSDNNNVYNNKVSGYRIVNKFIWANSLSLLTEQTFMRLTQIL